MYFHSGCVTVVHSVFFMEITSDCDVKLTVGSVESTDIFQYLDFVVVVALRVRWCVQFTVVVQNGCPSHLHGATTFFFPSEVTTANHLPPSHPVHCLLCCYPLSPHPWTFFSSSSRQYLFSTHVQTISTHIPHGKSSQGPNGLPENRHVQTLDSTWRKLPFILPLA